MTKVRVYRATVVDGHGEDGVLIVAPSKADAKNTLENDLSPHQRLSGITYQGWRDVTVGVDSDYEDVSFSVEHKGKKVEFTHRNRSHSALTKALPTETKEVRDSLRDEPGQN